MLGGFPDFLKTYADLDLHFTICNRIYTEGTVIEASGSKNNDDIAHVLFLFVLRR
jgi:hypothetical protein